MCTQHRVDTVPGRAGGLQTAQEIALAVIPLRQRPRLVVADAGVHQQRRIFRAHQKSMNAQGHRAVRVDEVRTQPGAHGREVFGSRLGQQKRQVDVLQDVDHPVNADVADLPGFHAGFRLHD
jgi:hypothetical protein